MQTPENVLEKYKDSIVDLFSLASELGLIVELFPMKSVNAMFIPCKNWNYIALNSLIPEKSQRFSLAHEIAHYLYWDKWFSTSMMSKYDFREKRADDFARNLLLPNSILYEFLDLGYTTNTISDIFWVPIYEVKKKIVDFFR